MRSWRSSTWGNIAIDLEQDETGTFVPRRIECILRIEDRFTPMLMSRPTFDIPPAKFAVEPLGGSVSDDLLERTVTDAGKRMARHIEDLLLGDGK